MSRDRRAGPFGSADPIDALIDDTARELTSGSPSPALRDDVRARLMPRRPWWRVPIWQPALGAAVVAVAVLVALRPEPDVPVVAPSVQQAVAAPRVGGGSKEQDPANMAALPVAAAQAASDNRVGVPRDPLPPIEQLVIERVPVERAVIEPLPDPMPIGIDRLQIERLYVE